MGLYETLTLTLGVSYAGMYPSMIALPQLWALMMYNEPFENFTDDVQMSIRALFLLLGTVIASSYFAAVHLDSRVLMDVTVLNRIFVVGPCVLATALLGQDPLDSLHMCMLMATVDWFGGVVHGMASPGGLGGVCDRFWSHWRNVPDTPAKMALRVDSYVGMAFGFVAVVYASFVPPPNSLAIMQTLVAVPVQYFWLWYAAHDPGDKSAGLVPVTRAALAVACLVVSEVYGFAVPPMRMQAAAMVAGLISPYVSAACNALSALYLYCAATSYVLTVDRGPVSWLIFWGAVTWATSEGWIWLFYDGYDDKQRARVLRTNWQDRILGVFEAAAGACLARAGHMGPGTVGAAVCYLLPPVTLWFTLETKMLNHMKVGTPFHPTWWVDGDLPKFSKTDYVNVTFGIATALITVILTSYAFWALASVALGFSCLSYSEPTLWKFAAAHGIAFVFHSGIWMIVASAGIPEVGYAKMWRVFPPPLPPFVRANPHDCVPMHKVDLTIGNFLLFLGGFCLDDGALGEAEERTFKIVVFLLWGICTANKIYIHYRGWGYVDPVTAGTAKVKES